LQEINELLNISLGIGNFVSILNNKDHLLIRSFDSLFDAPHFFRNRKIKKIEYSGPQKLDQG
jgi:hypothetical protein